LPRGGQKDEKGCASEKRKMLSITIKKRAKFVEISRFGARAKTDNLISICHKNSDNQMLVGYTASKKVGNAVRRNKAKRRMRSLVREMSAEQLYLGCSFVFIATNNTAHCDFEKLRADFMYCIKKSKERADKTSRK
jgi:ribonuclease P protein component